MTEFRHRQTHRHVSLRLFPCLFLFKCRFVSIQMQNENSFAIKIIFSRKEIPKFTTTKIRGHFCPKLPMVINSCLHSYFTPIGTRKLTQISCTSPFYWKSTSSLITKTPPPRINIIFIILTKHSIFTRFCSDHV